MFSLHTKRKRIILSVVFSIAALIPVTAIVTNLIKNVKNTHADTYVKLDLAAEDVDGNSLYRVCQSSATISGMGASVDADRCASYVGGYSFVGFRETSGGSYVTRTGTTTANEGYLSDCDSGIGISNCTTYTIAELTQDEVVYSVWKKNNVSMTCYRGHMNNEDNPGGGGVLIGPDGKTVSSVSEATFDSDSGLAGDSLSCSNPGDVPGWEFLGVWRWSGPLNGIDSQLNVKVEGSTISLDDVRGDIEAIALYRAVEEETTYTVTVTAVDSNNTVLEERCNERTVAAGGNVTVYPKSACSAFDDDDYQYLGYKTTLNGDVENTSQIANLNNVQSDITVYAVWEKEDSETTYTYTLKFDANADGDTVSVPADKTSGETTAESWSYTLTSSDVPGTRTGYRFIGWQTSSTTSGWYGEGDTVTILSSNYNQTQTLYAHWEEEEADLVYTVTLNKNGGTGGATSTSCTVTSGTSCNATVSSAPTKSGYYLLGWADSATATSPDYASGLITNLSGNKTVYAIWAPIYTLTYSLDIGSIASQSCHPTTTNGSCQITITNTEPAKGNHVFLGWGTNSGATSASYQPGATIPMTGSRTLYAVWAPVYTISFNVNGGSGSVSSVKCNPTTTNGSCYVYIPSTIPSRSGYSFLGWAESASASSADYMSGQRLTITENDTLYAVWEKDTEYTTYYLTFNTNGGTGSVSARSCRAVVGSTCSATIPSSSLTKSGYSFLGWADSASATEANYMAGNSIDLSANKVIYAVWQEDEEETIYYNYSLNYDANGGINAPSAQTSGSVTETSYRFTVVSGEPTRDGYNFLGWAKSSTATIVEYLGGSTVTLTAEDSQDVSLTLYAVWEEASEEEEINLTLTWVVGPEYIKKSEDNLVFTVDRSKDDFIRLEVDGEVVDEENYKVEAGEGDTTVITVYRTYLDTLDDGSHDIVAVFKDDNDEEISAESKFSVVASDEEEEETPSTAPNTGKYTGDDGNGINMLIALPVFGAIAVAGSLYVYRRKKAHIKFEL